MASSNLTTWGVGKGGLGVGVGVAIGPQAIIIAAANNLNKSLILPLIGCS